MTLKEIEDLTVANLITAIRESEPRGKYSEDLILFQNTEESKLTLGERMYDLTQGLNKFEKNFPNIELIYTDKRCIDTTIVLAWEEGILIDRNYETPKGMIFKGKVYINLDTADESTVHEASAHISLLILKKTNPDKYNKGLKLAMEDRAMVEDVKNKFNNLRTDEQIGYKILSQEIFNNLQKNFKEVKDKQERLTWITRIKEWVYRSKDSKNHILNTNQLSADEAEYYEEVKFCLQEDNLISLDERRILERLRKKLNIDEKRAIEIENILINK